MSSAYVLSPSELSEWYDRIHIPVAQRLTTVTSLSPSEQLAFLSLLTKHELCSVPWENLSQHYTWHHVIHIRARHLFAKIARQPGRGGYCMETNTFFHMALAALGFDAWLAGARIWKGTRFGGWTHVVNLVRLPDDAVYLVDGGYGGAGPPRPIPVVHDRPSPQIAPAQCRLVRRPMAQARDQRQSVWVYEHRFHEPTAPAPGDEPDVYGPEWTPHYCFVELEFTPEDVEALNFEPAENRAVFFAHKVVAARFTTDRERDDGGEMSPGAPDEDALSGEVDGTITLNHDVLKWRRRGRKVLEIKFKTDAERQAAIKKYFGITFTPDDAEGIVGTAAEIGASIPPSQL